MLSLTLKKSLPENIKSKQLQIAYFKPKKRPSHLTFTNLVHPWEPQHLMFGISMTVS